MKYFIYIVALFVFNCLNAQINQGIHVDYLIENNTGRPNTLQATLDIKDGVSIYLPKFTTQKMLKDVDKGSEVSIPDWQYMKIDHKVQKVVFFDQYGRNKFLVEDVYCKYKWMVTEETKEIAGHICYKATLDFRGVLWTAWFAPDIPLPYGPWKLYGLPGLIMEAVNDDNTAVWTLKKIEYKHDDVLNKDFSTLVETRNKKPVPLIQFISEQDEYYANIDAKIASSGPASSVTKPAHRIGYELKYEWEE